MDPQTRISELKERLLANHIAGENLNGTWRLQINRLPKNTYDRLVKLASMDEFAGDYGSAIKFLLDFYEGYFPEGLSHMQAQIDALAMEVSDLKKGSVNSEESTRDRIERMRKVVGGK